MPSLPYESIAIPVRALAWLGRQGTRALAAMLFITIALPQLGGLFKPLLTEAIFLLLCVSFIRVDIEALRAHLRRPGLVIAATAWTTLAVPTISGLLGLAIGLDARSPGLYLALMLQAVASPMMSAPALAALTGLDSTLVLITLVTSTAVVPLTAPLFAYLFFPNALTLSPLTLGLKLGAILGGALLLAAAIRRLFGAPAIRHHKEPIDGFNILMMFVFVAAVMESVMSSFSVAPLKTIALGLLCFAVFFSLLSATALIFYKLGRERAIALGMMVALRNMGLIIAATDGVLPGLTWLYFGLCQFPIYLTPQLLKPLVRKLGAPKAAPEAVQDLPQVARSSRSEL
jgi:BASS family bile acid:Na+ symporter